MISVVLLAGGKGVRMGTATPKQFLLLHGKPIALHSLELFLSLDVHEVVVVCDDAYRELFAPYPVRFADPGERRQDSLYRGLQQTSGTRICVHDAARPLLTRESLLALFKEEMPATLAVPMKATVREAGPNDIVSRSLDRTRVWEIQTPQLVSKEILEAGFAIALRDQITVTDDVALAELADHPIKLVRGEYSNLKITSPEDLAIAEQVYAQISTNTRL